MGLGKIGIEDCGKGRKATDRLTSTRSIKSDSVLWSFDSWDRSNRSVLKREPSGQVSCRSNKNLRLGGAA
jgi:hypothetical protein